MLALKRNYIITGRIVCGAWVISMGGQRRCCRECRQWADGGEGFPPDVSEDWYCCACWTEYFRAGRERRLRELELPRVDLPPRVWWCLSEFLNDMVWPPGGQE